MVLRTALLHNRFFIHRSKFGIIGFVSSKINGLRIWQIYSNAKIKGKKWINRCVPCQMKWFRFSIYALRLQTNGQEKKRIGIRINKPKMCKPGKCRSLFHLTFPQYILSPPNFFFLNLIHISNSQHLSFKLFYFFPLSARIFKTNTDQNHLSFSLLGYLGQLNFTVESKILAQTFGKINPVCEDSLNDI